MRRPRHRAGRWLRSVIGAAAVIGMVAPAIDAAPAAPAIDAVLAAPAAGADEERPVDARTYFEGIEALRGGDRKQAAQLLRRVLRTFPDSPYAPRAALELAGIFYPVTSWSQIGSASPESIAKATGILVAVSKKYRSSDEAAPALVRLGYLGMEPANPDGGLDGACARFASAVQLYPDNHAADAAYFGSGMCETLRERPVHAAAIFAQLLDEHPASRLAAEAHYRFGLALSHLDDPSEAVLALQEVRNRYPESPFASEALARITLIHRLRLPGHAPAIATTGSARTATAGAAYRVDTDYGSAGWGGPATAGIRGISDIAIDPQGLALVASPKSEGVFRLDPQGRIQERIDHPGPGFVSPGVGLAVFISGKEQIAVNNRNWSGAQLKGVDGRAPRDFGPIALDQAGRVHLLDRRDRRVLIFDRDRRMVASIEPPAGKEGRFVDLATGDGGTIYALDGRSRTVTKIRHAEMVGSIDLASLGIADPAALAVDGMGDLFLLDGKQGIVTITDPDGRRITEIRISRDLESQIGIPSTIAVDPSGRVYLGSQKSDRLVRLR